MQEKTKNILKIFIGIFVSLALVTFLLVRADIDSILYTFKKLSSNFLILLLLVHLIEIFIGTYKWKIVVKNYSIFDLFKGQLISCFFSMVLPGQFFGEVAKTIQVTKNKNDLTNISATVIFDKITGLISLLIVGAVGCILSKTPLPPIIPIGLSAMLGVLLSIVFLLQNKQINIIINRIIEQASNKFKSISKLSIKLLEILNTLSILPKNLKKFLLSLSFGFIYQLLIVLTSYLISRDLNIYIHFYDWCWIIAFLSIALLMPLSFGGIGIREGSLVGLLGIMHISPEKALAISLVLLLLNFATAVIGGIILLTENLSAIFKKRSNCI